MNDEYQTRGFHEVTHFHKVITGGDGKPVALALYEPDQKEIRFLQKTDMPKVTETKI